MIFDKSLPEIGQSLYLSLQEYEAPWEGVENSHMDLSRAPGWLRLNLLQASKGLSFDEYSSLCTPEYLTQTQMNRDLYDQFLAVRKSSRENDKAPPSSSFLYVVTVKSDGVEFVAVCRDRGETKFAEIRSNHSFQFFKRSGDRWQYDVPFYAGNPFSVLPYSDLGAIKEMIASGKARVDEAGKLKPAEK